MIKEHFNERELEKLLDPCHECACNLCGKDLQYLKQKAAQEAVAEYQQSHPDPSESKRLDEAQPGLA